MGEQHRYSPPLALTILSAVFLGSCAVAALWIAVDILHRRGWKTMMAIMIPVYILNALYLAPLTLWTYLNYGRPGKPGPGPPPSHCASHSAQSNAYKSKTETDDVHNKTQSEESNSDGDANTPIFSHPCPEATNEAQHSSIDHASHASSERPMFATVTVGVCHCGAGCLLGDIVGEWLVYATGAEINSRSIWPAWLIDYAFALLFGIVFQYFSIAPMSGDYSLRTIWRALKADILSLTSFEIGLFGWMAIFQIAIFDWKLEMNTATYWWMMQICMFLGHWTAVPMNYWLIAKKVKEPCA